MTDENNTDAAFSKGLSELYTATLTAIHHLGAPEVLRAIDEFTTPALADFEDDADLHRRLTAFLSQANETASRRARKEKDAIYAPGLRRLGEAIRQGLKGAPGGSEPLSGRDDDLWQLLQAPFRLDEVELSDLRLDPEARTGTASPIVKAEALVERLQRVASPSGWSVDFHWTRGGTMRCRLDVLGASRTGVVHGGDLNEAAGRALRSAARLFGIGRGLHGEAVVAVEVDEHGLVLNEEEISRSMLRAGVIAA